MNCRWIVELDYNADPDMDSEVVRKNLQEELIGSKGSPRMLTGSTILFDHIDDAFNVRLRFNDNIIGVERDDYQDDDDFEDDYELEVYAD